MNGFIAGTVFIWPDGGNGGIQPPAVCVGAPWSRGFAPHPDVGLRLTPGKALFFRRGAQTGCSGKAPAAVRVCALEPGVCASHPGKPCFTVDGRKPFTGKSPRRRWKFAPWSREFAPHTRESLILPLRGANFLQGRGAGVCVSLRPTPGKALFFRRVAQTFCREEAPAAVWVCASFPGKLYFTVEGRKPFTGKSPRRLCGFAPHSRESLILPSRGANQLQGRGAGGGVGLRLIPRKALFFR